MRGKKDRDREPIVVKQIVLHQMITIEDLAAWLNISVTAIRQMIYRARRGRSPNPIPFYQPGGKGSDLRFDFEQIEKWARQTRN